ncbi:hypothetical protein EG68_09211 [Paragonimus skrjabini miyazakii]|uniref:Uncharacterized protein n=1 Tax=Paragonimus skrjabini miyazakii TaxID=59628 RepID=A0A8S9YU31_9TREM|nr:hypothetical protein EG68_09211 [Paragonimus skrjabini miyazakii]
MNISDGLNEANISAHFGGTFGDGTWYHDLSNKYPLTEQVGLASDGSAYLVDNHTQRFHTLLGVNYRISPKLDRLQNVTSGRRKRGAQQVGRAPNVLAFAVCDRMVKHKLILGIPGRLIEVNRAIAYPPASTPIDTSVSEGGSPDRNYGNAGTYLCIIAPSFRSHRKRGSKKQHLEKKQTELVVDMDLIEGHLSAVSSDYTTEDDEGDTAYLSSTEPWVNKMRDLTGETVLTWKQYSQLRKL